MVDKRELKDSFELGCYTTLMLATIPAVIIGAIERSLMVTIEIELGVFVVFFSLSFFGRTRLGGKVLTLFALLLLPSIGLILYFKSSWLGGGGAAFLLVLLKNSWIEGFGVAGVLSLLISFTILKLQIDEGRWEKGFLSEWRENLGKCSLVGSLVILNGASLGVVVVVVFFPVAICPLWGISATQAMWGGVILGIVGGGWGGLYLTPIFARFIFEQE